MSLCVPLAAARPTTQADRASSNALSLFRRIIDSANAGADVAYRLHVSDLDRSYAVCHSPPPRRGRMEEQTDDFAAPVGP